MLKLVTAQNRHMISRGGEILFYGTMSECMIELGEAYVSLGKLPTLSNVIRDGFIIEEAR